MRSAKSINRRKKRKRLLDAMDRREQVSIENVNSKLVGVNEQIQVCNDILSVGAVEETTWNTMIPGFEVSVMVAYMKKGSVKTMMKSLSLRKSELAKEQYLSELRLRLLKKTREPLSTRALVGMRQSVDGM